MRSGMQAACEAACEAACSTAACGTRQWGGALMCTLRFIKSVSWLGPPCTRRIEQREIAKARPRALRWRRAIAGQRPHGSARLRGRFRWRRSPWRLAHACAHAPMWTRMRKLVTVLRWGGEGEGKGGGRRGVGAWWRAAPTAARHPPPLEYIERILERRRRGRRAAGATVLLENIHRPAAGRVGPAGLGVVAALEIKC